jgi:hypothetical protein
MLQAILTGLPGLRAIEHDHPDSAQVSEVVEATGKDIGVHIPSIFIGN